MLVRTNETASGRPLRGVRNQSALLAAASTIMPRLVTDSYPCLALCLQDDQGWFVLDYEGDADHGLHRHQRLPSDPLAVELAPGAISIAIRSPDGESHGALSALPSPSCTQPTRGGAPIRRELELVAPLLGALCQSERELRRECDRTERARAEAAVDPLTEVANRRVWARALAREDRRRSRYRRPLSICVIDLVGLKQVNDVCGHAAGDQLLRRTAEALRAVTREHDVVARLGGDEFGLLALECDYDSAHALERRLLSALALAEIDATIGVAVANGNTDTSAEEIWQEADRAMYRARKQGGGDPLASLVVAVGAATLLVDEAASP